jgi:hypothetical protein
MIQVLLGLHCFVFSTFLQVRDVCFTLHKQQHLVGILHEVDCLPSYYVAGGLVFAPLSLPCMEAVYGSRCIASISAGCLPHVLCVAACFVESLCDFVELGWSLVDCLPSYYVAGGLVLHRSACCAWRQCTAAGALSMLDCLVTAGA